MGTVEVETTAQKGDALQQPIGSKSKGDLDSFLTIKNGIYCVLEPSVFNYPHLQIMSSYIPRY